MNKTVELVNEWAGFEKKTPDGSIEDFCKYYLGKQRSRAVKGKLVGGVIPPFNDGLLLKILGRITKLNMFYANKALEGTGVNQIEEFGVLATIAQEINARKTDIIYSNLLELSSGTDLLNRLKARGLIREHSDENDRRSKRISLTIKGLKVTAICYDRITRNTRLLLNDLANDDKELCVHILKGIEIRFSALWLRHKSKSFDEICREVILAE
ncbi:MAG TPA: hypothetical protein VK658_06010 [Chryseolinea sp.]|nr:hypothetical protein [Chryseolinea sp.]